MALGDISQKKEYGHKAQGFKGREGKNFTLLATAVLVVLIVAVAVFLFFMLQPKQPPPYVANITSNGSVANASNQTVACDDECLFSQAISTVNYSLCGQIKNESRKQGCLLELSHVSLEACVQLQNYTNKKSCIEWHAMSQKSTEVCNNLEVSDRKTCIEKVDPCFYKVLTDKSVCIARLNKNYTYCEKDEECLFGYAELENDANACNDIDSKVKKQVCLNLIENKDKCSDLLLASQIDYCKQLYAIRARQSDICDAISIDTTQSYDCYVFFATEEKNLDFCKKLSLNDRWNCYKKYSIAANDVKGCEAIDKYASSARYTCFLDLANAFDNASVCEYVEDASQKVDCYYIAMGFNNEVYPVENCAGIQVVGWKDSCYSTLAKRTGNVTICDYVLSEGIKKQCISTIKGQ